MARTTRFFFRRLLPAFALLAALLPSRARAAAGVGIVQAYFDSLTLCAGSTYTLTVVLQDNAPDGVTFTPTLYAEELPASYGCGNGGFSTAQGYTPVSWDIHAGTNPAASTGGFPASTWPNDGGWVAPVTMSYTGQTFTENFAVAIMGTDDAATGYEIYLGANAGYQDATGANAYACVPYVTCPYEGSMVPSSTTTPLATATASPTQTPDGISPTATVTTPVATASPTRTPDEISPTATMTPTEPYGLTLTAAATETEGYDPTLTTSVTPIPLGTFTVKPPTMTPSPTVTPVLPCRGAGLVAYPNLIKGPGAGSRLKIFSCDGGKGSLRILRISGRPLLTLWTGTLQPGQSVVIAWDGLDAEGGPVASGVYVAVFTDSNGRRLLQKVLVVR